MDISLYNKLLYVPFNREHSVGKEVADLLTEEEFFSNCFVTPSQDEDSPSETIMEDEERVNELTEKTNPVFNFDTAIKKPVDGLSQFNSWITSNDPFPFIVLGDAGTGKSTWLHYLKYSHKKSQISFVIVDVGQAKIRGNIIGKELCWEHFSNIYSKGSSALMEAIIRQLNISQDQVCTFGGNEACIKKIAALKNNYNLLFYNRFPPDYVKEFFEKIPDKLCPASEDDEEKEIKDCKLVYKIGDILFSYFSRYVDGDMKNTFNNYLTLLVFILYIEDRNNKYILSFDGLERFIGKDQISCPVLGDFVTQLREYIPSINDAYEVLVGTIKVCVFMRRTTLRSFTSVQTVENLPHRILINSWFSPGLILDKKFAWLEKAQVLTETDKRAYRIISKIKNDIGISKQGVFRAGIYSKLGMLFGENKRHITRFILEAVQKNEVYWGIFEKFWEISLETSSGNSNLASSTAKFAARSIMFQLVLEELFAEGYFLRLELQNEENNRNFPKEFSRKLLSVLYNYSTDTNNQGQNFYFPLRSCVERVLEGANFGQNAILQEGNEYFMDMCELLYNMDYYSPRDNYWMQVIDINPNNINFSFPHREEDQRDLTPKQKQEWEQSIRDNYDTIQIKLTNTGIALLFYVISSFEFFSCVTARKNAAVDLINKYGNIPPLFCTIPKVKDIRSADKEHIRMLDCIKIIELVSDEVKKTIDQIKNNVPIHIPSFKDPDPIKRIVDNYCGYIGNFVGVIKDIYSYENKEVSDQTLYERMTELFEILNHNQNCMQAEMQKPAPNTRLF